MGWKCYSCGASNPNSADECQKCGNTVAAPRAFYLHWVFGGAVFFILAYALGVGLGGTFVAMVATPSNAEIFAAAAAAGEKSSVGMAPTNYESLDGKVALKYKEQLAIKHRQTMSVALYSVLQWSLAALLFVIAGIGVGFASDGKTIWEAGLGSILGQILAFVAMRFLFGANLPWLALAVCLAPGFGLAVLGAWIGEHVQTRHERAIA